MRKLEKVKRAMLTMQRYSWEQGVAAQAMIESGEKEWAMLLAREAVHRSIPDGRVAVMGNFSGITDPCANGEAIGFARNETSDPLFVEAYNKLLEWAVRLAPRNNAGIVYHLEAEPEFWVDSFYMLPPFLAYAGYFEEAIKQIDGYWSALFDKNSGLLSHMWHDDKKKFTRKDFWGVGNGWALAGMSRVLSMLPENERDYRQILISRIMTILVNSIRYQRKDNLFHDVINDPDSFVETNFPQMLAYTIFSGLASGWLPEFDDENKTNWLKIANNIRGAVYNMVDDFGYVQGVCGAPDFNRSGNAVEGQAFFILMEAAAQKLGLKSPE